MKTIFFILIPILLIYPNSILADDKGENEVSWKLWKKNSTLSVSYRPAITLNKAHSTDLIEIKATAKVNSTLSAFLFFIQQVDNTPNWLINAEKSSILEQLSPSENVFYIEFFGLWPLKQRLLVAQSAYWQNDDLSVEIELSDAKQISDTKIALLLNTKKNKFLRIKTYHAHWKLTPQSINQQVNQRIADKEKTSPLLFIEYTFVADGAGDTPQWLANHLALKSIWKSLNNIEQQLPEKKWQQSTIEGIVEP